MEENENNQTSESSPTEQKVLNKSFTPKEPQLHTTLETSDISFTPKKISKKLILIGLVFLIIVLIISGLYLYLQKHSSDSKIQDSSKNTQETLSPTPDPTAGWIVYKHEKLGFEFKYPAGWNINSDQLMGKYSITFTSEQDTNMISTDQYDGSKMTVQNDFIIATDLETHHSLSDIFNNTALNYYKLNKYNKSNYFGGIRTYNVAGRDYFITDIFIARDNLDKEFVHLTYRHEPTETGDEIPKKFDQILSTFEFIE